MVTRRLTRTSAATALVLVSIMTFSACQSAPPEEYAGVRARLDFATHTIWSPLDDYVLDGRASVKVTQANAFLIAQCMGESGFDYPRASENWDTKPVLQDRLYGLWSEEFAAFGYEPRRDPRSLEIDEIEETLPDEWWTTWDTCIEETDQLLPFGYLSNPNAMSPADTGHVESVEKTRDTATYRDLRAEWGECLESEGITIPDGDALVPNLPDDVPTQLRIAAADVACKTELGLVQQVADLQAQFEASYISDHESDLAAYRAEAQKTLAKAEEIIRSYAR